jgi:hypothetical protein
MTANLITSASDPLPKPKPASTDSFFFNLNDYVKSRLLFDTLQLKVLPACRDSKDYLILVLDDFAAGLISNFCTTFELMEAGNIYQIEKLGLSRKRYPMSDVVYIVQPSQGSIQKVIEDFPAEDQFSFDQYGTVHLCFLTQVPDERMQEIARCPKLVGKVRTLVEVNLDFKVWQDNVFKFPCNVKQMTQLLDRDRTSAALVEKLSQKIFTVCSVMGEKPYIQYQSESPICEEVAMSVYKKLEYLYNYSATGDSNKKKKGKKGQDSDHP